jgi:hypothetical protein
MSEDVMDGPYDGDYITRGYCNLTTKATQWRQLPYVREA